MVPFRVGYRVFYVFLKDFIFSYVYLIWVLLFLYISKIKCFSLAHTVADIFLPLRHEKLNKVVCWKGNPHKDYTFNKSVSDYWREKDTDWKKFLSVKENQQALLNFFGSFSFLKLWQILYDSTL